MNHFTEFAVKRIDRKCSCIGTCMKFERRGSGSQALTPWLWCVHVVDFASYQTLSSMEGQWHMPNFQAGLRPIISRRTVHPVVHVHL